ncbi:MAG: hypothetical protein GY750_04460 [Lentisphaerae bacterium]|nr:hypothetical protein [Lentisphaerota bacterium]MCP4100663.1 hypothetical protein [Lentisphaerota bacterium]
MAVFQWRYYRDRASFIANCLEDALQKKDFDRAVWIITEQARVMFTRQKFAGAPANLERAYGSVTEHASPPPGENSGDLYYSIIHGTYQELLEVIKPPAPSSVPGVAQIHRVWMGRDPGQQRLTAIRSGNIAMERIWRNCRTNQAILPEQFLWTNVKALLNLENRGRKLMGTINVRHVDELETNCCNPNIFKYIRSFIHRSELAFASDLLRFVIMEQHGGLFLGTPWKTASRELIEATIKYVDGEGLFGRNFAKPQLFSPNENTLKTFFLPCSYPTYFINTPGAGLDKNYLNSILIKSGIESFAWGLAGTPDTDICYVGRKNNPVFVRAIEIICELFNDIGEKNLDKFITSYRKLRYKNIKEKWLHDREGKYGDPLKPGSKMVDSELREVKAGEITNVYPMAQALADYGYIAFKTALSYEKLLSLAPDFAFIVKETPLGFFIPELDLFREGSSSWTNVSLKDKLSTED